MKGNLEKSREFWKFSRVKFLRLAGMLLTSHTLYTKKNAIIFGFFQVNNKGVASTFEVVRPGSRSSLLWVYQEVGVFSFCCRLHVLFYF